MLSLAGGRGVVSITARRKSNGRNRQNKPVRHVYFYPSGQERGLERSVRFFAEKLRKAHLDKLMEMHENGRDDLVYGWLITLATQRLEGRQRFDAWMATKGADRARYTAARPTEAHVSGPIRIYSGGLPTLGKGRR